ncbi:MAG: DUF4403 family protein [Verrucomicrobiales bacterium]
MKQTLVVLAVVIALGIAGVLLMLQVFGPRMIFVPAPSGQPLGDAEFPRPETSLLAVNFAVPLAMLEDAANAQVPERLRDSEEKDFHKHVKKGQYAWEVARGPIRLKNLAESLAFAMEIDGAAKFSGEIDARILRLPLSSTAEIGGVLGGTVSPEISPDWHVDPKLTPHLELSKANLSLGGVGSIDIGDLLGDSISQFVQKEARKLTPAIRKQLALRREVADLWNQAYISRNVSEDPPVWLNVTPRNVLLGPIDYSDPDQLGFTVAIESETFLTNREPEAPARAALPDLRPMDEPTSTNLKIPLIVNMTELNEILATESMDTDTGFGTKLEISGIQAEVGQEGFMNLRLDLEADQSRIGRGVAGQIWVRGRPMIDYDAQTLAFTDVELTVETRDRLTAAATWLLDDLLVRGLERKLRIDLNEYKEELNEEVRKAIQSADLPEGIDVSVQNLEIDLEDVYTVTRQFPGGDVDPAIVFVIRAQGDMDSRINERLLKPEQAP